MKKLLLLLLFTSGVNAQMTARKGPFLFGADQGKPDASALMELISTTKGFLPPRMTEAQRDAISSPATGLIVFNTDSITHQFYTGTDWGNIGGAGGGLSEWEASTAYAEKATVFTTPDFKIWIAKAAFTSGVTFDSADWDELSNDIDTIASSTDNAVVRFDGTGGGTVQDSAMTVDDSGNIETTGILTIGVGSSREFDVSESLYRGRSTGVAAPVTMAINGDTSKFDVGAFVGQIITVGTGDYFPISFAGQTGITPTNSNGANYVFVDSSGSISQQTTLPTPSDRREEIFIGRVITNSGTVTVVLPEPVVSENPINVFWDFALAIGQFNAEGNVIGSNGSNLEFSKTSGKLFSAGANYVNDRNDPSNVSIASCAPCSYLEYAQTGTAISTGNTVLDPTQYDVAGTPTTITGSGNRATNQRIYLAPSGNIIVAYGQTIHPTIIEAQADISSEAYTPNPILGGATLIGIISIRKSATDLSDPSDALFSVPSKFGETVSASGGSSAAKLQDTYDISDDGEIVLDSTRTSFEIRDNSTPIGSALLEVLSNDESTTYLSVDDETIETSNVITAGNGTLSLPTYSFTDAPSTGMYREGGGLNFSYLGSRKLAISGETTSYNRIFWQAGSAGNPGLKIFGAGTYGFFGTVSSIGISSDGTQALVAEADNLILYKPLTIEQETTPSTPASGYNRLYFKSDDNLYRLNSSGTEVAIGVGTATPSVRSVTTTDSPTTSDDILILSGASFNVTLPDATASEGKIFKLIHNGTSLSQGYTLNTTAAQTIGGVASGDYNLVTNRETLEIVSDGANWVVLNHYAKTKWVDAGAMTIEGVTSDPSKGVMELDKVLWLRNGSSAKFNYRYKQTSLTGTASGSGDYLYSLPPNMEFDSSVLKTTAAISTGSSEYSSIYGLASSVKTRSAVSGTTGTVIPYDATRFRILTQSVYSTTGIQRSNYYALDSSNNIEIFIEFTAPIAGWEE